jgi:FtsP/CotA-like multicopper oxidase with cupredoxin domain
MYRALTLAGLLLVSGSSVDEIRSNDNRESAGDLRNGVLTVHLVAGAGAWFPEAKEGPAHQVYAFGEARRGLSNPGPLLRVPVGTEIRATIQNRISSLPLEVHGLYDRPGTPSVLSVPSGETRRVSFRVTVPGTYFYWGSTRGVARIQDRFGPESQLLGALIVDPLGDQPRDQVFVIGIEDDSGAAPADRHTRAAVINGRSWPHSQISTVTAGDTVRMRWINASDRSHPIHLHGFYFTVHGRGDIAQDTSYDDGAKRLAVTELMLQGRTMSVTWVPERPGNWLMHCHMSAHMSPELRARPAAMDTRSHNHTMAVMAGLVIGWRVLPSSRTGPVVDNATDIRRRNIRLLIQSSPRRFGSLPGLGFVIQDGSTVPRPDSVVIPGPPLVLTRGEPVQINVINNLPVPTSIHWHGIELDSYFDGVSGWSGNNGKTSPHVNAGDSFAVRFTPPRAGTFIYHSHFDEDRQLGSGMSGPLIVLEPGVTYDPGVDQTWFLSQAGPARRNAAITLNGSRTPVLEVQANRRYRIRLINIAATAPLIFSLSTDSLPAKWRAIAKDGADLPPSQALVRQTRQIIGVGETYDFEFTPESAGEMRVLVTDLPGRTRLTGLLRVHR